MPLGKRGRCSDYFTEVPPPLPPPPPAGEAVVLRGQSAACGLPPACHLSTRRHLALPLAGMTQAGRKHINGTVLPAWQQSCKEGSGVRKCGGGGGGAQIHQRGGAACLEAELQGGIRCEEVCVGGRGGGSRAATPFY